MYQQAEDGKTELSLMHFAITNPGWQPPRESTAFLGFLKEQVQRDGAAAGLAQGGLLPENALFTSIQSLQSESEVCSWAWEMTGRVASGSWDFRTGHGVEGLTLSVSLSAPSVLLGRHVQDTGDPEASLCPVNSAHPCLSQPLSLIANVVAGSSCRGPPLPRDLQGSRHRAEVASALRSFSPLQPGQAPAGRAPSTMTGSG